MAGKYRYWLICLPSIDPDSLVLFTENDHDGGMIRDYSAPESVREVRRVLLDEVPGVFRAATKRFSVESHKTTDCWYWWNQIQNRSLGASQAPTTPVVERSHSTPRSSKDTPPAAASAKFRAWRDAWDELGEFQGRELPEPQRRVSHVLELWLAPIPEPWMRSEADTPQRLLSGPRYTRKNRDGIRRGEHEIEYEILVMQFDRVTFLGQPLLDGVNAYPLVKDSAGGRNDDVEADLVLLVGRAESALLLVSDVKKTDGNPWTALVQNLRQLRLFTANPECASLFNRRGVTANVVQICGGVIAPEKFYSSPGQKANSLPWARKLSESILRAPHKVCAELLVWDPGPGQLYRV
jgi:hypothetical protein